MPPPSPKKKPPLPLVSDAALQSHIATIREGQYHLHPLYRDDLDRGFKALLAALASDATAAARALALWSGEQLPPQ